MAVTKSQLAQWSKEYEAKHPDRKNKDTYQGKTTAQTTAAAQPKTERVTREQLAQWGKEFDAKQQAKKTQERENLYAAAYDSYRTNNNLGLADELDSRSDWLNQQDLGTKDVYKDVNRWRDTDDNQNLMDAVRRVDSTHGAYTDADLIKNGGWTQAQIDRAREINAQYDTVPLLEKAERRIGNSAKSVAANVSGAAAMAAGALPQAVGTEVKDDDRTRTLMRAIQRVDGTNGMYTDRDLIRAGWTAEEIADARARLAQGQASVKVDNPVYNWGRDTHQKGEELLADAQAGESGVQKFMHSAALSAGENLVLGAVNPALVLPVLSLQGAGDSLAASDERGESPEKAMTKAALKFGAGWAINRVGAADLAKTMGSDYAKDTVAGQIADFVRGMAGESPFAQQYPAIANAVSGGIDNAMQAFVESYADQAIDAALGDTETAQKMFTKENFLSALESGLSGGVSGAMGGAAGTGVGAVKEKAKQTAVNAAQERAAQAGQTIQQTETAAKKTQQRTQEPGMQSQTVQEGAAEKAAVAEPKAESAAEEKTEPAEPVKSQNANPAVRQFEQAVEAGGLTGKTIRLFTPEAGNEANRAALEEAYGVKLPETAASTRRMLRDLAAQQNEVKSAAAAHPEIKPQTVEKAGEMVETSQSAGADSSPNEGSHWQDGTAVLDEQSPTVQKIDGPAAEGRDYSDAELKADPAASEGSGPLRETYGLREPSSQTARQAEVASTLKQWGIKSDSAVQDISQKLPKGVEAKRYAAAASTIYRVAQMEEVKSFDDALKLAGAMNHTALNVSYVLDSGDAGRLALKQAYLYGADIKEQPNYGGQLTSMSTSGEGTVYYKGTLDHNGADMGSRLIELNAKATGTDAILQNVLQNDPNVKAYVDTETGRIFFGDSVTDLFGTILHEDYHWYNSLDSEGAKTLQDHALQYLAEMDGYESVDEMIREKLDVYARQGLTYAQAAEELVADAWRGIFSTEADFKCWVEFQRGQAEKNAGTAGKVKAVMNRVKKLLTDIISRAKEVLTHDPDNAAALKAKRLAEAERRILQDEYFAHAEKAMDNLRAAKENAAALKTEDTAGRKGIRFSIQKNADGESYIKIDEDILKDVPQEEWKAVVKQTIKDRYPNGFQRNGWTILNHKDGRSEFVRSKSTMMLQRSNEKIYVDKMRMAANLDEIIQTADEVYREPANHKNAEAFNRGKIEIQVGQNFYEADVLTAIKADDREIFYDIVNIAPVNNKALSRTHMESNDSGSSLREGFIEPFGGTHIESEDSRSRLPKGSMETSGKAHMESEDSGSRGSEVSKQSIAQESTESKRTDEPVKKSVRFQLGTPVEVDTKKDLVAVHNLTEENLIIATFFLNIVRIYPLAESLEICYTDFAR